MPSRLVKQPNGLYARFSTVVDNFTSVDMTRKEAWELVRDEFGRFAADDFVAKADAEPQRWEDACATILDLHPNAKPSDFAFGSAPAEPDPETPGDLYVCSDLHLGHEKIASELAHRPANFETLIFQNFGKVEWKPGDVLINCGDAGLYKRGLGLVADLNRELEHRGVRKILMMGNHDPKFSKCLALGFDMAMESMRLTFRGKRLYFSHEPAVLLDGETYNIHGHLHQIDGHRGGLIRDGKHILISSELMEYRPIPLTRLVELKTTPKWNSQLNKWEKAIDAETSSEA